MKRILRALPLLLLLACSKEEAIKYEADPYYKSLNGHYRLEAIYTDTPIDLNFDGVQQTDMLEEMDCFLIKPLDLYFAIFEYQEPVWYNEDGRLDISFDLPNSQTESEVAPFDQCFIISLLMYNDINLDKETGIITTTEPAINEPESGKLTSAYYADEKFYFTVDKIIFTSDGWQTLPMHFVYTWYSK